MRLLSMLHIFLMLSFLCACNKDSEIEVPETKEPQVVFENGTGVYQVKVMKSVTITPTIIDAVNPKYKWLDDKGKTVGKDLTYTFSSPVAGEFYFTFCLEADNGNIKEEIRIDVVDKLFPSIVLPKEMETSVGKTIVIEPAVNNSEGAEYLWTLDNHKVSTETTYTFVAEKEGVYNLQLTVKNEDGEANAKMQIRVYPKMEMTVSFQQEKINVFRGRKVCLAPLVRNAVPEAVTYKWMVNQTLQPDATEATFDYKPTDVGETIVTVTVTDGDNSQTASIVVNCLNTEEDENYRPATSTSQAKKVKVYEFMPAPGQFVNQIASSTMDQACKEAENLVNTTNYVSLGSFGGYIVVGFDHSVLNKEGDYDFAIQGNSFDTSNEPGIVWVMQDENGNGLPDDTWYELRGSETDKPETRYNYSVTYYRPSATGMPIVWVDSENNTGTIDLHPVYPSWQKNDSYTLFGTCLKPRTEHGSIWANWPFEWGYVDNFGSDRMTDDDNHDAGPNYNYFKIENAMYPDKKPVNLKYIDFIKVQCGILSKAGVLGEVSTEVFGFWDYNLK